MVLAKKVPMSIGLSYAEERALREKEQWFDSVYRKKEIQQGVAHDPKDLARIKSKLEAVRSQLRFAPTRAMGSERVRIEMEVKKIEDRIRVIWGGKIPTWSEYWIRPKEGGIHYNNLRDKIVEVNQSREYAELIRRWQFLRRRLEPQDKNIANTLHLHKH
jgi:hypothetical protein